MKWHNFLDSIDSLGGNIVILFIMWLLAAGFYFTALKYFPSTEKTFNTIFSGIYGALVYAITASRKPSGQTGKDS